MSKGRLLFYLGFLVCATFWFSAIHARMTYLESLEVGYKEPEAPNTLPMNRERNQMEGAALVTALWLGITWWRVTRRSGSGK